MWIMRPTPRGWGLLVGGSLFALSGVGWGSTDVTRLGLIGPLVVAAGAAWVLLVDPTRGRHALRVAPLRPAEPRLGRHAGDRARRGARDRLLGPRPALRDRAG